MRRSLIQTELLTSCGLISLAALWSAFRSIDVAGSINPSSDAFGAGCSFGLGLAALLPLVTASWAPRVRLLRGLRQAWNGLELALGDDLPGSKIIVIALCSAISEEVFFRGILQPELGIVVASLMFGLVHPFGVAYVLWASAAGAGFGALFVATGSLLAPAAAHATYNVLALTYLRHRASRLEEYA